MVAWMRLRRSLGRIDASTATAGDPGSPLSLARNLSPVIWLVSTLGLWARCPFMNLKLHELLMR